MNIAHFDYHSHGRIAARSSDVVGRVHRGEGRRASCGGALPSPLAPPGSTVGRAATRKEKEKRSVILKDNDMDDAREWMQLGDQRRLILLRQVRACMPRGCLLSVGAEAPALCVDSGRPSEQGRSAYVRVLLPVLPVSIQGSETAIPDS